MKILSLLCLLPVIQGQITISILASRTPRTTTITHLGSSSNIITKEDKDIFNITETVLKNGVSNLTGRVPTNVFLNGPTPWNDLYKTYNWEPVKTIIKPIQAKIVSVEKEKVVLKEKTVVNENNVEKKHTIRIDGKIENKMTTLWNTKDVFAANITYNVDVLGMVNAAFSMKSLVGENIQGSHVSNTDTTSSIEVNLPPNGNITAILTGTKVTAEIEIEYAAILDGHVVTNNEVKLQGHHFWSYNVGFVLAAANVSDIIKVKEIVSLQYYTDYMITVGD